MAGHPQATDAATPGSGAGGSWGYLLAANYFLRDKGPFAAVNGNTDAQWGGWKGSSLKIWNDFDVAAGIDVYTSN